MATKNDNDNNNNKASKLVSLKQFASIIFNNSDQELKISGKWPLFIDEKERGNFCCSNLDSIIDANTFFFFF